MRPELERRLSANFCTFKTKQRYVFTNSLYLYRGKPATFWDVKQPLQGERCYFGAGKKLLLGYAGEPSQKHGWESCLGPQATGYGPE